MRELRVGDKIHIRGSGYSFHNEIFTITGIRSCGGVRGYVENNHYDKTYIWNVNSKHIEYITPNKNLIGGKLLWE